MDRVWKDVLCQLAEVHGVLLSDSPTKLAPWGEYHLGPIIPDPGTKQSEPVAYTQSIDLLATYMVLVVDLLAKNRGRPVEFLTGFPSEKILDCVQEIGSTCPILPRLPVVPGNAIHEIFTNILDL